MAVISKENFFKAARMLAIGGMAAGTHNPALLLGLLPELFPRPQNNAQQQSTAPTPLQTTPTPLPY